MERQKRPKAVILLGLLFLLAIIGYALRGCLLHFDITLTINHLTFLCKPTVSECLFNVYLIEGLNLQGRLERQQYGTNIQELTSYV